MTQKHLQRWKTEMVSRRRVIGTVLMNASTLKARQEELHEFKYSLSYIVSSEKSTLWEKSKHKKRKNIRNPRLNIKTQHYEYRNETQTKAQKGSFMN